MSKELVVEERNIYNKLFLGRITFTENMKRFGGILLAVELYTFDQFLGVFWSFFLKNKGGGQLPPVSTKFP